MRARQFWKSTRWGTDTSVISKAPQSTLRAPKRHASPFGWWERVAEIEKVLVPVPNTQPYGDCGAATTYRRTDRCLLPFLSAATLLPSFCLEPEPLSNS